MSVRIHHRATADIVARLQSAASGQEPLTEEELLDLATMIERDRARPLQDYNAQTERVNFTCKRYGLKAGELQWQWRMGQRSNPLELEDAIVDALWQGCIPAHPGDGVGCASQIASYQLSRATKFRDILSEIIKAEEEGDEIGLRAMKEAARTVLADDDRKLSGS